MVNIKTLRSTLFLDIETVPIVCEFNLLSDSLKDIWIKKCKYFHNEEDLSPEEFFQLKAGIYSEFAKIVCISVGVVELKGDRIEGLRLKSFFGNNEVQILVDFIKLLTEHYPSLDRYYLCGHNIKEFDIPFLCRRLIVNQVETPKILQISGKKPWETKHLLDTLELWKFGDYKKYTSLNLLAAIFNIPSPKDDIDGSMVQNVYYNERDVERIARYCEKDVVTVCQVLLRMSYHDLISEDEIVSMTFEKR